MAKQTVGIGTTPNDNTGDSLRAAFIKINANADELYTDVASKASSAQGAKADSALQAVGDGTVTEAKLHADVIAQLGGSNLDAIQYNFSGDGNGVYTHIGHITRPFKVNNIITQILPGSASTTATLASRIASVNVGATTISMTTTKTTSPYTTSNTAAIGDASELEITAAATTVTGYVIWEIEYLD